MTGLSWLGSRELASEYLGSHAPAGSDVESLRRSVIAEMGSAILVPAKRESDALSKAAATLLSHLRTLDRIDFFDDDKDRAVFVRYLQSIERQRGLRGNPIHIAKQRIARDRRLFFAYELHFHCAVARHPLFKARPMLAAAVAWGVEPAATREKSQAALLEAWEKRHARSLRLFRPAWKYAGGIVDSIAPGLGPVFAPEPPTDAPRRKVT
jgi:hypothetical protein